MHTQRQEIPNTLTADDFLQHFANMYGENTNSINIDNVTPQVDIVEDTFLDEEFSESEITNVIKKTQICRT